MTARDWGDGIPGPCHSATIAVGAVLEWPLHGDRLVLQSRRAGIRRAQALMSKYKKPGQSVVDELIAERRREAARE